MAIIHETPADLKSKFPGYLTVPAGELAGKQLAMALNICDSPICECTDVRIALLDGTSDRPVTQFAVDVGARAMSVHEGGTHGAAQKIADTVVQAFDDSDWKFLWDSFAVFKESCTENLDPTKVECDFPMSADIEDHGELVPYGAILPHAKKFLIEYPGEMILLDEQYCLARDCDCDQIAMAFVAFEGEGREKVPKHGEAPLLYVGYRTGKVSSVDSGDSTTRNPKALLNDFVERFPDLMDVFAKRHKQLAALYEGYWNRRTPVVQLKSAKVGRNDPCPCGSGKKHKKCCGLV